MIIFDLNFFRKLSKQFLTLWLIRQN